MNVSTIRYHELEDGYVTYRVIKAMKSKFIVILTYPVVGDIVWFNEGSQSETQPVIGQQTQAKASWDCQWVNNHVNTNNTVNRIIDHIRHSALDLSSWIYFTILISTVLEKKKKQVTHVAFQTYLDVVFDTEITICQVL